MLPPGEARATASKAALYLEVTSSRELDMFASKTHCAYLYDDASKLATVITGNLNTRVPPILLATAKEKEKKTSLRKRTETHFNHASVTPKRSYASKKQRRDRTYTTSKKKKKRNKQKTLQKLPR